MPTKAQLERVIIYAIGGLTDAHTRFAMKGCWCPGAGDEVCDLHLIQDVLAALKSRTLPGDRTHVHTTDCYANWNDPTTPTGGRDA